MPSSRILPKLGLPQIASLVLLLLFFAQCLWFMAHVPITQMESSYIEDGLLHVDRLVTACVVWRCPFTGVDRKWPDYGQNDAIDPTRTIAEHAM